MRFSEAPKLGLVNGPSTSASALAATGPAQGSAGYGRNESLVTSASTSSIENHPYGDARSTEPTPEKSVLRRSVSSGSITT